MAAIAAIPIRIILASPSLQAQVFSTGALQMVFEVVYYFLVINVFLCIFNLLPIPPLDGWKVLLGLLSPQTAWRLRQLEVQYAMIIPVVFLAVILFGGSRILVPIVNFIIRTLIGTG
jgi:Zn-dependent protease